MPKYQNDSLREEGKRNEILQEMLNARYATEDFI